MMIAVGALLMTSCSNANADAASPKEDSVEAVSESVVLEEAVEPSSNVEAVTRGETSGEGFGRCLASGCHCKSFEGRGQTCRNCGHAYKKHY